MENKVTHGFELTRRQEIKEIGATINYYKHLKSGAELIYLENEDNNKVFNITFRTVPEDDTGCPHILEHSVLNGSKNFPAKGTFMELIKGSLNTFINAMTSSDWTSYPVASTNDKDFINLMRVYLDAVLNPLIYEDPRILQQEGWHYELFDKEGEINYRGVVYNEMKGAFSSVDSIIVRNSTNAQFPDTPYGFESGGDPDAIPQLTQEKFAEFHSKYYHPSNSLLWLYGDINLDETLKIINDSYLKDFDDPKIEISFPMQKPFAEPKKLTMQYPLGDDMEIEGEYHMTLNYSYGRATDPYLGTSLQILAELLMNTPASPLKLAIRQSGLCKDSMIYARADVVQPTIHIILKQIKKEDLPKLSELINQEMQRIAREGFDKKLIEATLNAREFALREAQMQNFPKGLFYSLSSIGQWIHGGDPIVDLAFEDYLAHLRKGITEPLYEKLLEEVLLKNKHRSEIVFEPVPGMIAAGEERVRKELEDYKNSLSEKEIEELIEMNIKLKEWQETPDSEEDMLKIPMLSLSDVDTKANFHEPIVEKKEGWTLLRNPVHTNGIVYIAGYLDLAHAPAEDIPWIRLYSQLLGQIESENYGIAELNNEIRNNTGGISLNAGVYSEVDNPNIVMPKLVLSGKAVAAKTPQLIKLMAEFILRPLFKDEGRIKSLISEFKAGAEQRTMSVGHGVAITRMLAYVSKLHKTQDSFTGLGYLHFLSDVEKQMESDMAGIIAKLNEVQKRYLIKDNLVLSLTANEELIPAAQAELDKLLPQLSQESYAAAKEAASPAMKKEGITAPIKVQYVVKGGDFRNKGYKYSGKMMVLGSILSTEHLYKELRVKGGAYGGGGGFRQDGLMFFYSYRDPNLQESLEVYNGVADSLKAFDVNRREMDKFILGVISSLDYPKTPETIGVEAGVNYITGMNKELTQKIRDEVLSTNVEDIRGFAEIIEKVMADNHYAVVGSETKVKENSALFDEIIPVIKK